MKSCTARPEAMALAFGGSSVRIVQRFPECTDGGPDCRVMGTGSPYFRPGRFHFGLDQVPGRIGTAKAKLCLKVDHLKLPVLLSIGKPSFERRDPLVWQ